MFWTLIQAATELLVKGRTMRQVLAAILLSLAVWLPSCRRSSPEAPPGFAWVHVSDNCTAYCFTWPGEEIVYVLFLCVGPAAPAASLTGGGGAVEGDTVSDRPRIRLDGKEFSVEFTSATPDLIRVDGQEHRLSQGRVFVCATDDEGIVVKQVGTPIQPNKRPDEEVMRLAGQEAVRQLLSEATSKPVEPGT